MEMLNEGHIEPQKVKKLLHQLLSGIADCHMKRIIHRDLKPANILIDKNCTLALIQKTSKSGTLVSREPTLCQSGPTRRKL
jgi:serine/threonine protein kinase